MKKVIALLLTAIVFMNLAACGATKPNPKEGTVGIGKNDISGENAASTEGNTAPTEENTLSYTFTRFGNAKITILGAEMRKDEYDEDFMRIYYEYVNNDKTAAGHIPSSSVMLEITQNGEELYDYAFTSDDEAHVQEDLFYNCAVQPGIPVRNTIIIYCSPNDGPIDIAMHVMVGSWAYNEEDVEWFKFQMDPENLMPAPTEPYVIQPITNPVYALGLPASGTSTSSINPFNIVINGYELTTYDDQLALRVKLTYTHQHEWEMSPYTALNIFAFQDGISLEQVDTWYLDDVTPEDEAYENVVAQGETVECNAIFLLRNNNPVEVVIEQPLDALRVGIICTVK